MTCAQKQACTTPTGWLPGLECEAAPGSEHLVLALLLLGHGTWLEEVGHWGWALKFPSLELLPVCSLLSDWMHCYQLSQLLHPDGLYPLNCEPRQIFPSLRAFGHIYRSSIDGGRNSPSLVLQGVEEPRQL